MRPSSSLCPAPLVHHLMTEKPTAVCGSVRPGTRTGDPSNLIGTMSRRASPQMGIRPTELGLDRRAFGGVSSAELRARGRFLQGERGRDNLDHPLFGCGVAEMKIASLMRGVTQFLGLAIRIDKR